MVKKSLNKISPLAPKGIKRLSPVEGVSLYTYCANLYNKQRNDLALFLFCLALILKEKRPPTMINIREYVEKTFTSGVESSTPLNQNK